MKKHFSHILTLACIAAAFVSASAQNAAGTLPGHIGNQPAASNLPRSVGDDNQSAAVSTTYTGTIQATITAHLVTPVPTGGSVVCGLTASVVDISTTETIDNEVSEEAETKATVSGSTATCVVKIPHSWYLPNASHDTVSLGYSISIIGSSTSFTGVLTRSSSGLIPGAPSIKVPPTGSTTSFTISATL
jgi:hypothetical protein